MAALTVTNVPRGGAGQELTYVSANGGGDTYTWSKNTVLHIKLGATDNQTVTATRQRTTVSTPQGLATLADAVLTTNQNADHILDTRDESFCNASGNVVISYSGVTNMTVVPVKFSDNP